MLKVAQVFLTLPVGGAEDLVVSLFPEWAHLGVEQIIVCLRSPGSLGEELLQKQQPLQVLKCAPSKRWNPFGVWRLAAWLKKNEITIVHSHVYNSHLYAVPAAVLARIPVVIHHHKTYNHGQRRKNWTLKQLDRWTSAHICLAESTRTDLVRYGGVAPDKVAVLANGIDTAEFKPASDPPAIRQTLGFSADVKIVGNVASLTAPKNQVALVEMAAELRLQLQGFKVVICGEGPLRSVLERRIAEAHLDQVIQLMGKQRPIAPWFQVFDLLVFPSTWEGQPLALLQAMACGVAVIASRIEGNVAALGADHPGLVDGIAGKCFTERVRQCLSNQADRRKIVAYQNARIVGCTLGRYVLDLKNLYERALTRR